MDSVLTYKKARTALSLCDMFWVFATGSVFGYLVEMVFCAVFHGRIENRSSMIFGPLNTVYGFGTLALYICSFLIGGTSQRNTLRKLVMVFIYGAVAGTVVEYASSWVQETVFGTVSWDYTGMFMNVNGRVCLLFTVCWGVLALFWHLWLQQPLERVLSKVAHNKKRSLAAVCAVLFAVNAVVTVAAVARWQMRLDGAPAVHAVWQLVDRVFPNSFMESTYANMRIVAGR